MREREQQAHSPSRPAGTLPLGLADPLQTLARSLPSSVFHPAPPGAFTRGLFPHPPRSPFSRSPPSSATIGEEPLVPVPLVRSIQRRGAHHCQCSSRLLLPPWRRRRRRRRPRDGYKHSPPLSAGLDVPVPPGSGTGAKRFH